MKTFVMVILSALTLFASCGKKSTAMTQGANDGVQFDSELLANLVSTEGGDPMMYFYSKHQLAKLEGENGNNFVPVEAYQAQTGYPSVYGTEASPAYNNLASVKARITEMNGQIKVVKIVLVKVNSTPTGSDSNAQSSIQNQGPKQKNADPRGAYVPNPSNVQLTATEYELIYQSNLARQKYGRSILTVDPYLMSEARRQAQSNASRRCYNCHSGNNTFENVFYQVPTVSDAVSGWLGSPAHAENLLNQQVSKIGGSIAYDDLGISHWVQNFIW